MHHSIPFFFFFILTIFSILSTLSESAHHCSDQFQELANRGSLTYKCQRLPTLGAELGWSRPLLVEGHYVVKVLFGAPLKGEEGWLAWGVNPGLKPEMVGTRAAIGIKNPSRSSHCKTYNITKETKLGCQLRKTDLEEIKCSELQYDHVTNYHFIFVSLNLSTAHYNVSKLNIVWQIGSKVDGDEPRRHAGTLKNVDSVEKLNLCTGTTTDVVRMKIHLRKVHGIINIIGWGTLLPMGAITARFFKKYPFQTESWWYRIHIGCQFFGVVIGVIGWSIGLWLGHASPHYIFIKHRILGIIIFVLAIIQSFAICLKPKETDDSRRVWNVYHHLLGYCVIGFIYWNIFEGIKILKPENKWKWRRAVIGILGALGFITLMFEVITWRRFIAEKNEMTQLKAKSGLGAKAGDEEEVGTTRQQTFARNNNLTSPKPE